LRDKNSATIFHYACASPSASLVESLLKLNPTFVYDKDIDGRTGLFYVVWNNSSKQVEMLRHLASYKVDINGVDNNLRTALHHASLGARARVIPFLC